MLKFKKCSKKGMTITELLISVMIGALLIGIVLSMWYFAYRNWAHNRLMTRLRLDLEVAIEQLKAEMRLSSATYTSLYKSGANYVAIGFPSATLGGSGFYILDANGNILWDKFIIYHLDGNELKRTEFTGNTSYINNDTNVNGTLDRIDQLNDVAANGSATVASPNNGNATTKILISNVSSFTVTPDSAIFDGYSDIEKRSGNIKFGSVILDPTYASGYHDVTLTAVDKNNQSNGYDFGIDSISITPSGCEREAEFYLTNLGDYSSNPGSHSGGSLSKEYRLGCTGNNYLEYSGVPLDGYVNLKLYYDLWRESNFSNSVRDNAILTGNDLYVQLTDPIFAGGGVGVRWQANTETGTAASDYNDVISSPISMADITVRNLISGGNISENSNLVRVEFKSHSLNPVTITTAYIDKRNTAVQGKLDAVTPVYSPPASATRIQLYFTSGGTVSPGVTIPANSSFYSNWTIFPITTTNDYLVTFHISVGNISYWPGPATIPPTINSSLIYDSSQLWILDASWPTPSTNQSQPPPAGNGLDGIPHTADDDCFSSPSVYVTASLEGWLQTGTVTSVAYDTQLASPTYGDIDWNENLPTGSSITVETRSSSNSDMSSATSWAGVSNGGSLPGGMDGNRYAQFMATLSTIPDWTCINHPAVTVSDAAYKPVPGGTKTCTEVGCTQYLVPATTASWIDDVTLNWDGPERMCDISGYFMQNSDYGIIKLTVDGNDLIKGFGFDIAVSEDFQGKPYGESISAEIEPRNTGK